MRYLTIKRTKSFVGCLVKLKIYIEDPTASDIKINSVPCRKLGEIKNGTEETFVIGDEAAKVFVIADTLSKNYCNEFYQLPSGQEDISLSGKCKYNPANGNAFRFDNNDSEEVLANRKRGTKTGLIILIVSIIVGFIIGFLINSDLLSSSTPSKQTFTSDGMSITLTDEFTKTDIQNFTVAYNTEEVVVFALKESFSLVDGFENYTLEQYGNIVIQNNGLSSATLKTDGDMKYFEYEFTNQDTKDTYHYYSYVYKASDAFWLIQFATLTENTEDMEEQIHAWAKSVKFSD